MVTVIVGAFFIGVGIVFIIITAIRPSSYFTDIWNDLSTADKKYFDNKESDMKEEHRINSFVT